MNAMSRLSGGQAFDRLRLLIASKPGKLSFLSGTKPYLISFVAEMMVLISD